MISTSEPWFVYIVQCADSTLYTGIAKDVAARIDKHNARTGTKYTRARGPVVDVYREEADSRSETSKREMQIKTLSSKEKLTLIM
ncbi:GIY-YIG nuclease family protein [Paraneptunicella aestuarii]|uniref:GIY-YIG nuclease family protein n=1 Tax=Paraneptunicella aestuarii TaxID=2831148 RepID=UPI001E44C8FB|nr:GIY-YIG nuclease family protein [Paraneptunicella aestuarii]UAA39930.1 GIY-YIG nuclease family protein [Paraneptunicella aestuarii]